MTRLDSESSTPARDGFAMPGEWAPHARSWMCWPCRPEAWGGPEGLAAAKDASAEVARAIARFEPVVMCARPEDAAEARFELGEQAEIAEYAMDDSWARDFGPTFLTDARGHVAGVQWRFNAWGGKYEPYANDAVFATTLLKRLGRRYYAAPIFCEGGAIHSDGAGTLLTTEQCLLNPNRNPGRPRGEIEDHLRAFTGAESIVWLGSGFADRETDGHVDNIACFAGPSRVILGIYDDASHPNYAPARESLMRLENARGAGGDALEIVELKQPRSVRARHDGTLLEASYINFYFCNGAVVMPAFGDPNDDAARDALADLFPDREIVQVEATAIVQGGGGIHCITQQEPKGHD